MRLVRENGRAYLPRYLLAFLFMAAVAACTSLSAWIMGDVINRIFRRPRVRGAGVDTRSHHRHFRGQGRRVFLPGGVAQPDRLATVLGANLIDVVDAGRVVESGTHAELLRADGAYARLYQLQFADEAQDLAA